MHVAILSRKIIDVPFSPGRREVRDEKNKVIKKAIPEVAEKSHMEVAKIFAEIHDSEVDRNKHIDELDYYEVIAEPGKATLKKVE